MAYSSVQYQGDGINTVFTVPFSYLDKTHVGATVAGHAASFSWLTSAVVKITPAPVGLVSIRRSTPKDSPPVDFSDGAVLKEKDLDLLAVFSLYCAQEAQDAADEALGQSSLGIALAKIYQGSLVFEPTERTSGDPLEIGDMYYSSSEHTLKVYTGTLWQAAGATVPGTVSKPATPVVAIGGETSISVPGGFDPFGILVFVNGAVVSSLDVDLTSGTDIVFSAALGAGDEVSWIAFGIFSVANVYTKTEQASSTGAANTGYQNPATGGVTRTVAQKLSDVTSVKDLGAKGDGVTDDTAAIQAALNASLNVYFPAPAVAYYTTADLTLRGGHNVFGDGSKSIIRLKDGSINGLVGTGANRVVIRDLGFDVASLTNATAYKAAVNLVSSGYCVIENLTVAGMGYDGIRLYDSSFCRIVGNRFSAFFGAVQDQADIAVMNNSGYNIIEGNFCYGGGDHGIMVQDPYTGSTPTGNIINRNIVGAHKANGILIYVTTAYDTQTTISNNRVGGITGTALAGKSGAGIYVQSAGGTIVSGNQVSDCCQQTTDFATQGVGHIAVAIGQYGSGQLADVIVAHNRINAPRGVGIYCASSDAPIIIDTNNVMTTGVSGSVQGQSIYAVNCQGVRVTNNTVRQSNPNYQSIQIAASNQNVSAVHISDNFVKTAGYGIAVNKVGTGNFSDVTIAGNRVYNGSQTAMTLEKVTDLIFSSNNLDSTGVVFTMTDCVNGRFSNNRIFTSLGGGSYGVIFTGTAGSGNYVDESNMLGGIIENDATSGTMISQYGTAGPAMSGLWANGDRVIARYPSIGNPKGWRCTANGNPGTWISEGNL